MVPGTGQSLRGGQISTRGMLSISALEPSAAAHANDVAAGRQILREMKDSHKVTPRTPDMLRTFFSLLVGRE